MEDFTPLPFDKTQQEIEEEHLRAYRIQQLELELYVLSQKHKEWERQIERHKLEREEEEGKKKRTGKLNMFTKLKRWIEG